MRNQPCDDRSSDCFTLLAPKYYFYIAIENSDCFDYISEKVWNNAFLSGMVPIVWSRVVNYKELLPPHSYINVADYATVADFAVAVKESPTNPHIYLRYHTWRKTYAIVEAQVSNQGEIMCDYLSARFGQNLRKHISFIHRCVIFLLFGFMCVDVLAHS